MDSAAEKTEHTLGPWERVDTPDYAEIHPRGERLKSAIALVGSPEDANLIAAAPDMLAALLNVRKIISEAAQTGFNWKDGDWADRLYESQQMTSAAISKATS